jgi:hypothetical protein
MDKSSLLHLSNRMLLLSCAFSKTLLCVRNDDLAVSLLQQFIPSYHLLRTFLRPHFHLRSVSTKSLLLLVHSCNPIQGPPQVVRRVGPCSSVGRPKARPTRMTCNLRSSNIIPHSQQVYTILMNRNKRMYVIKWFKPTPPPPPFKSKYSK